MNFFPWLPDFEDQAYLDEQLITYIGNKRRLLPFIEESVICVKNLLTSSKISILDGFAGSGVVSRMFKQHCSTLYSNDLEPYTKLIGDCYLANRSTVPLPEIVTAVARLNRDKRANREPGIIERLYAPANDQHILPDERCFYTNANAKIIDNMRRMIDDYPQAFRPFLIAPLLHKASIHANTSGVFKGFYKDSSSGRGQFGGNAKNCLNRITKEIDLPIPVFSRFECDVTVYQRDINDLVGELAVDLAYFDPPYNQHPYGSNYFMLNVIASYTAPTAVSKVSGIPDEWNKSNYNKKEQARQAFDRLIRDTKAKFILVSYSNEGILTQDELHSLFEAHGRVELRLQNYSAFRASRNLNGRSKTVQELLFVIDKR